MFICNCFSEQKEKLKPNFMPRGAVFKWNYIICFNPILFRKAAIVHSFSLSACDRVNGEKTRPVQVQDSSPVCALPITCNPY